MRETAELEHSQRKCKGKVKLRDAEGNYLRHPDGSVQTRPCKAAPIRGGFVCPRHGGSAPQVKKKAEKRLQAMLEPSIVRMDFLMHQDEHLPTALAAVLAVQNRVLGAVGKPEGEKDMRPVINIGIAVGGIQAPEVQVSLPGGGDSTDGEVVDNDDSGN